MAPTFALTSRKIKTRDSQTLLLLYTVIAKLSNITDGYYGHLLLLLPGVGHKTLIKLSAHFETFEKIWYANATQLKEAGLSPLGIQKLNHIHTEPPHSLIAEFEKTNTRIIAITEPTYPHTLKQTANPPAVLYIRGSLPNPHQLLLAVVGTRKMTPYGKNVVATLLEPLMQQGIGIVSGLAFGVDAEVSKQALKHKAHQIAVLGSGPDTQSIYPKEHTWLAEEIIKTHGCIISEYPPGTQSLPHHFAARNRIIAGIATATLIIESDIKGGSLITAAHALEEGRQVYAVPGPIYAPGSAGTNNLIKMGALCVTQASDILHDLHLPTHTKPTTTPDNPEQQYILNILNSEPIHTDIIIAQTDSLPSQTLTALTYLELKGLAKHMGGGYYIKT